MPNYLEQVSFPFPRQNLLGAFLLLLTEVPPSRSNGLSEPSFSFFVLQSHSYSSLIHRYVSYFPVFSPRFFGIIPVARRFSA